MCACPAGPDRTSSWSWRWPWGGPAARWKACWAVSALAWPWTWRPRPLTWWASTRWCSAWSGTPPGGWAAISPSPPGPRSAWQRSARPAVGPVLPASVIYDVLLSPFVLYAVIRARALAAPSLASQGLAGFPGGSASQPLGVPGLAGAVALFSGSGAVVRDSGTGAAPRLKARTLRAGSSQGGSASGARPPQARPARAVHLKFGGGGGGSALSSGSAAAARAGRPHPGRAVNLHLGT